MPDYAPARIRAAFDLRAVTLTAWHNTYGLAAGTHQPNGHRRYTLADAACIAIVARLSGDLGFLQHRPAVALANALRVHFVETLAAYARFGDDLLVQMDDARPGAVCRFHTRAAGGGWDICPYGSDAGLQEARTRAGGDATITIDFADLIRATLSALGREAATHE